MTRARIAPALTSSTGRPEGGPGETGPLVVSPGVPPNEELFKASRLSTSLERVWLDLAQTVARAEEHLAGTNRRP